MTSSLEALDRLERDRQEWRPWLAVVREVLREAQSGRWDSLVPASVPLPPAGVPLLAGVSLADHEGVAWSWIERLLRCAARAGMPVPGSLPVAAAGGAEKLFAAALFQDPDPAREVAAGAALDGEALQAVVAMIPVPFLLACTSRWQSQRREGWTEGYCPTCGAWPAFVEVRGIERSRVCRCGRCGGEWHADALACGYCGTRDHEVLVSLVPERGESSGTIDACTQCRGYLKTFTRLQGCAPADVLLEDLRSVDLDVAAIEQGYRRPSGAGYLWQRTAT